MDRGENTGGSAGGLVVQEHAEEAPVDRQPTAVGRKAKLLELAPPAVAGDALHRKLGWSIASGSGQMYIAGGAGNENGNPGG